MCQFNAQNAREYGFVVMVRPLGFIVPKNYLKNYPGPILNVKKKLFSTLCIPRVNTNSDIIKNAISTCTHEYWAQDASSKAYDEPFDPGAVAERWGIEDLVRTMGGCHTTNLMSSRKSHRLPTDDLIMLSGAKKITPSYCIHLQSTTTYSTSCTVKGSK